MNQVQVRTGLSLAEDNEALASDYEAISVARQFVTGQRLVEALGIASGEHVLDIGCGTGLLVEHIAGIVGPTGHAHATLFGESTGRRCVRCSRPPISK